MVRIKRLVSNDTDREPDLITSLLLDPADAPGSINPSDKEAEADMAADSLLCFRDDVFSFHNF